MQTTTHTKEDNVFPIEINQWLNDRGLSNETLNRFDIHWNGQEIVIPVHNNEGDFLFNKYRRSPFVEDGPKYKYDKGSGSVLFNSKTLNDAHPDEPIFIVEGELDCLALENLGIKAVTSTGGAGTFSEEWVDHFVDLNNLVICFDNDTAGIRGGMNVQSLIPGAMMMVLPEKDGKDITDYLLKNTKVDLLSLKARRFNIPKDVEGSLEKKEMVKKVKEFKDAAEEMRIVKREMLANREPLIHVDAMSDYLINRHTYYKQATTKPKKAEYSGDGNDMYAAKQVPITTIIQFRKDGYAPCIWHSEKTASMYYNKEGAKFPNTVKCFGCGAMGDPVDVVMQMEGVDLKEAIKRLTGK